MMKKFYKFGDYYSPLDILKIAKKKYKRINLPSLMPISAILFLFNIILSIILYPIFILNKFFCFLEIKSTAKTIPLALIATVLAAAFDWIFYIIYLITMPIQRLCVTVYKIFPNKVKYFSNQFVKTKAKDIAEVKEFTRLDFYETIEYMKKIASYDFTQKISSSELEDDFEEYYYKTVIEGFSNHNIGA